MALSDFLDSGANVLRIKTIILLNNLVILSKTSFNETKGGSTT